MLWYCNLSVACVSPYVDPDACPDSPTSPKSASNHLSEVRCDQARKECCRVHQTQEVTRRVVEEILPGVDRLQAGEEASIIYRMLAVCQQDSYCT